MYLLSVPELEDTLSGLVLVSTAPNAFWMSAFEEMTRANPLPVVDAAVAIYEADPSDEHLKGFAVASAPWNFRSDTVCQGAELLARMPYNDRAVDSSAKNFDATYAANWWPVSLPTLIISGDDDRIVTQTLWDAPLPRPARHASTHRRWSALRMDRGARTGAGRIHRLRKQSLAFGTASKPITPKPSRKVFEPAPTTSIQFSSGRFPQSSQHCGAVVDGDDPWFYNTGIARKTVPEARSIFLQPVKPDHISTGRRWQRKLRAVTDVPSPLCRQD